MTSIHGTGEDSAYRRNAALPACSTVAADTTLLGPAFGLVGHSQELFDGHVVEVLIAEELDEQAPVGVVGPPSPRLVPSSATTGGYPSSDQAPTRNRVPTESGLSNRSRARDLHIQGIVCPETPDNCGTPARQPASLSMTSMTSPATAGSRRRSRSVCAMPSLAASLSRKTSSTLSSAADDSHPINSSKSTNRAAPAGRPLQFGQRVSLRTRSLWHS